MNFKPVFLYSDIFFFAFIGALVVLVLWGRRRDDYREAARRIFSNWLAMLCMVIICVYGMIALLDSIHYRVLIRDKGGEAQKNKRNEKVYGDLRSVLDAVLARAYSGIKARDGRLDVSYEKSYSRPLAEESFERVPDPDSGEWNHLPLEEPGAHLLGTDKAGGDVFYKLIKGVRTALIVGLVTTMIAVPFAMLFGVTAGYFGGKVDDVIQFIYITLGSIPSILLISAMMMIVRVRLDVEGGQGAALHDDRVVLFLCAILGLISWSGLCRLLRGETIKIRELDYVQAARALGVNDFYIIVRHVVPNVIHVVLISSILRFSGLVMVEAILAYINIGVPASIYSWGRVVDGAREQLGRDPMIWWPVFGAFLFMFFLVLSINVFGDALRDALDPKLRQ